MSLTFMASLRTMMNLLVRKRFDGLARMRCSKRIVDGCQCGWWCFQDRTRSPKVGDACTATDHCNLRAVTIQATTPRSLFLIVPLGRCRCRLSVRYENITWSNN